MVTLKNKKTGNLFESGRESSSKHFGSVKVVQGVRMLELPSGKMVPSHGTKIKGNSNAAKLARKIKKSYESKGAPAEVATYIGEATSGEIALEKKHRKEGS